MKNNKSSPSTVITGDAVFAYNLLAIRGALKLEIIGLRRRGPSASMLARKVLNCTTRSKTELLRQFELHLVSLGVLVPVKNNS